MELKRPGDTQNTGQSWREINGGMTREPGLSDTQGVLPSQPGSTLPAAALLCGLSSTGRGTVGQHGTGPSPPAPQGAGAAPWRARPPAEPAQPPLLAASPPWAASAAASAPPAPGAPAKVGFYPPPTKGEQSIQTGQVV